MLVHYSGGGSAGAVGGVLSGSLPNPGFAADMATQAELNAAVAGMVPVTLRSAVGTTSSPTTASTADPMTAVIPEMTITADFAGHPILAIFTCHFQHSAASVNIDIEMYDAGTRLPDTRRLGAVTAAAGSTELSIGYMYTPAAGSRTIDVRWRTGSGTITAGTTRRQLIIVQFG